MSGRAILILTQCYPPDVGGIERLIGGLAGALAGEGDRVEVFADAGDAGPTPPGPQVRRFGGPKPLRRWWKAAAARTRLTKGGVDGVFADTWKSLERLAPPPGAPAIACLAHGMELPAAPKPAKAQRIRAALAKADVVIANSADTAVRAAPFVDAGKVRIVHPPAEPPGPADPALVARLRARLGEDPVIFTLARLEPRKGVDRVIAAMPSLPGARYAIAGDGPDRARLEALAAASPAADRIVFFGRVDEAHKAALFALAAVFAMPVRTEGDSVEGFGIVYREAAFAGVPALAGRAGGAAEAVVDGETGLLCDGGDPESVRAALARLLGDAALRARLAAEAKRAAEAAFGWAAGAQAYRAALFQSSSSRS